MRSSPMSAALFRQTKPTLVAPFYAPEGPGGLRLSGVVNF